LSLGTLYLEIPDQRHNLIYKTIKNKKCQWGKECILQGQKAQCRCFEEIFFNIVI